MIPELYEADPAEPERYELREGPAYQFELNRREFVQILGAGILLTMAPRVSIAQSRRRRGGGSSGSISERIHIAADGAITLLSGKVEVGQGSRAQLTMAAAEELGVAVDRIKTILADTSLTPNDGMTAGSRTTPSTVPRVRQACAAARELLISTAAEQWKIDPKGLIVENGNVIGPDPKLIFSYADLARGSAEALKQQASADVQVRAVSEWKVLGTPQHRVDAKAIVTGSHQFPSDIVRPGMVYGKVLRAPSYGAKLQSIDLSAADAMDAVTAVRDGDFVGFTGRNSSEATRAMEAAAETSKWDRPAHPSSRDLYTYLKDHPTQGVGFQRSRQTKKGSIEQGLAESKSVLRESYNIAYIQHVPLEPRAAVAEWEGGKLTVWTGTQMPGRVRGQLAQAFRIDNDNVRVIVPDTGGGFGGKHTGEVAVEAARLARAAGRPVKLVWTREEEFTWAYFRPAGVIEIEAGLGAKGDLRAWNFTNYNSGASAIATPYDVANQRTQFHFCDSPLREGSYRALASTANVFARESMMDELAAASGAGPLEFRRAHLTNERLGAVLEAAAERFGFDRRRKKNEGSRTRGVGLSCGIEKMSYVAACAEVEVDPATGEYKVLEIRQAYECGAIQNPSNLRAQVEGCVIMGLGGALSEEIHFEDGKITNPSLIDYAVPRFADVPKIDIELLNRPDIPSVGAGETPIVAVAPAIANALFAATGERIRSLPIRNDRYRPA